MVGVLLEMLSDRQEINEILFLVQFQVLQVQVCNVETPVEEGEQLIESA